MLGGEIHWKNCRMLVLIEASGWGLSFHFFAYLKISIVKGFENEMKVSQMIRPLQEELEGWISIQNML